MAMTRWAHGKIDARLIKDFDDGVSWQPQLRPLDSIDVESSTKGASLLVGGDSHAWLFIEPHIIVELPTWERERFHMIITFRWCLDGPYVEHPRQGRGKFLQTLV